MFWPRSIAAEAPPLDREVLRAALDRRRAVGLPIFARRVADHSGLSGPATWSADPPASLLELARSLTPRRLALPALLPHDLAPLAELVGQGPCCMDFTPSGCAPGLSAVQAAIDAGAEALLLAPVAGEAGPLSDIIRCCAAAGLPLLLDLRRSSGTRLDPATHGPQVALLAPDGEACSGPVGGAVLVGRRGHSTADLPKQRSEARAALRLLGRSLRDEPRLRRLIQIPGQSDHRENVGRLAAPPPPWALRAALQRLQAADGRSSQRRRHRRALRGVLQNVPNLRICGGDQQGGHSLSLLVSRRDPVRQDLLDRGVGSLPLNAALIGPSSSCPEAARAARELLLLPIHPFYRDGDLRFLAEAVRRSLL